LTEKQGLRFDIYERVHLAGEVGGLEQLDQLELLPYIQVLTQGDQAVLKGHLQLTGQFTGTENRESKLEHTIPVEITLPMNRIPNLEEIGVDIENFDIDLVAPKTLNVTGVLSLSGIELTPSAPEWEEREKQEEEVFVHQWAARSEKEEAAEQPVVEPLPAAGEPVPLPIPIEEAQEPQVNLPVETDPVAVAEPNAEVANEAPQAELPITAGNEPPQEANEEPIAAQENDSPAEENENADLAPAAEAEPEVKPAEKKEMKIAFAGKPEVEEKKDQNQLKSLIKEGRNGVGAGSFAKPAAAAAEADGKAAKRDSVEWKKLFLTKETEEHRFSSVRMCIVQREETVDSIAERYGLNPREIVLYNRMNDQSVREGQILYIPRR